MPSKAVELYKHYATAFSAISDQERRKILDSVLDSEIIYRNPTMEGTGHQIVIDDINQIQAKFPGRQFALHSVSEHHDVALMEWQLILADGTPGVRGHDAIRVTPEGKCGQIVTFAPRPHWCRKPHSPESDKHSSRQRPSLRSRWRYADLTHSVRQDLLQHPDQIGTDKVGYSEAIRPVF